jgi:hypothetical protein
LPIKESVVAQRGVSVIVQLMVGVRGFEPPASWSQTMRASRCATPRNWRIYHCHEAKSKGSFLSSTLTGATMVSPGNSTPSPPLLGDRRNEEGLRPSSRPDTWLAMDLADYEEGHGGTLLHRSPSFLRSLSLRRPGAAIQNVVRRAMLCHGRETHRRRVPDDAHQPPGPQSWGEIK